MEERRKNILVIDESFTAKKTFRLIQSFGLECNSFLKEPWHRTLDVPFHPDVVICWQNETVKDCKARYKKAWIIILDTGEYFMDAEKTNNSIAVRVLPWDRRGKLNSKQKAILEAALREFLAFAGHLCV